MQASAPSDQYLSSVINDNAIDVSAIGLTGEEIRSFEQIYIVACGSTWHVGMAAQYVMEDLAAMYCIAV